MGLSDSNLVLVTVVDCVSCLKTGLRQFFGVLVLRFDVLVLVSVLGVAVLLQRCN